MRLNFNHFGWRKQDMKLSHLANKYYVSALCVIILLCLLHNESLEHLYKRRTTFMNRREK